MNKTFSGGRQQKHEYWTDHIRSWLGGSLTQREYCDAHRLSLSSFSYWRNKLNKNSRPQPQFYPLTIQGPGEHAPTRATESGTLDLLVCDKRFCISIAREFNEQILQRLILPLEDI